jgi:hypothetical protein
MGKASLVKQLDDHQKKVGDILRWALPVLSRASVTPEEAAELMERRMELSRLLMEYALFKHREIFEPAIAGGGKHGGEAMRLKLACIEAGEAYRDHTRSRDKTHPIADWDTYRSAAADVAHAIRQHLAEERAGVRQLLGYKNVSTPAVIEDEPAASGVTRDYI